MMKLIKICLSLCVAALCLFSAIAFTGPAYPFPGDQTHSEYLESGGTTPSDWDENIGWDGPWLAMSHSEYRAYRELITGYLLANGFKVPDNFQMQNNFTADEFFEPMNAAVDSSQIETVPYDTGDVSDQTLNCLLGYYKIPGYEDRLIVGLRLKVISGTVEFAALCAAHHINTGFSNYSGEERFIQVYPVGTTIDEILSDAAEHLETSGVKPANDCAAPSFPGGIRVSSEKQQSLAKVFKPHIWEDTQFNFLYCGSYYGFDGIWAKRWPTQADKQAVYSAAFARHKLKLRADESAELCSGCYYSESMYRVGENYYAIDFCAKPKPDRYSDGGEYLTWLVVKPLPANPNGSVNRFYYSANTNPMIIKMDMAAYFKDPENGHSVLITGKQ